MDTKEDINPGMLVRALHNDKWGMKYDKYYVTNHTDAGAGYRKGWKAFECTKNSRASGFFHEIGKVQIIAQ